MNTIEDTTQRVRLSVHGRNELVIANMDLARMVVSTRFRYTMQRFTIQDLYQAGYEALIKAANTFTFERGTFRSFAYVVIFRHLINLTRNQNNKNIFTNEVPTRATYTDMENLIDVKSAWTKMESKDKRMFARHFVNGERCRDIGADETLEKSWVARRLERARKGIES